MQHPDAVYLVRNRCIEGKAFFQACDEVNTIIERTLAWAAQIHGILVYGYMFELNQFEMAIRAPKLNRQHFMRDFQSVIAREIKDVIGRTEKGFFAAPYDSEPILDDECLSEEIARFLCAPCEAGLVDNPGDWPGVSSWSLHETGQGLVRQREDRRTFHDLKQKYPGMSDSEASARATTTYVLEPAELPPGSGCSEQSELCRLITQRADRLRGESEASLGTDVVRDWPSNEHMPHSVRRRPRLCVAASTRRSRRFAELRRDANLYYDWARKRLRLGMADPRFPYGMIPLHDTRAVGAGQAASARDPTRRKLDAIWGAPHTQGPG
ncbi:MAG: hypothetical protein ACQEVA_17835 [Myxococcota bacterium]